MAIWVRMRMELWSYWLVRHSIDSWRMYPLGKGSGITKSRWNSTFSCGPIRRGCVWQCTAVHHYPMQCPMRKGGIDFVAELFVYILWWDLWWDCELPLRRIEPEGDSRGHAFSFRVFDRHELRIFAVRCSVRSHRCRVPAETPNSLIVKI